MFAHHLLFTYKILILVGFICSLLLFVFDKKELGFIKKKIGLATLMNNINIKIKRINKEYNNIPLPEYATEGSAGWI